MENIKTPKLSEHTRDEIQDGHDQDRMKMWQADQAGIIRERLIRATLNTMRDNFEEVGKNSLEGPPVHSFQDEKTSNEGPAVDLSAQLKAASLQYQMLDRLYNFGQNARTDLEAMHFKPQSIQDKKTPKKGPAEDSVPSIPKETVNSLKDAEKKAEKGSPIYRYSVPDEKTTNDGPVKDYPVGIEEALFWSQAFKNSWDGMNRQGFHPMQDSPMHSIPYEKTSKDGSVEDPSARIEEALMQSQISKMHRLLFRVMQDSPMHSIRDEKTFDEGAAEDTVLSFPVYRPSKPTSQPQSSKGSGGNVGNGEPRTSPMSWAHKNDASPDFGYLYWDEDCWTEAVNAEYGQDYENNGWPLYNPRITIDAIQGMLGQVTSNTTMQLPAAHKTGSATAFVCLVFIIVLYLFVIGAMAFEYFFFFDGKKGAVEAIEKQIMICEKEEREEVKNELLKAVEAIDVTKEMSSSSSPAMDWLDNKAMKIQPAVKAWGERVGPKVMLQLDAIIDKILQFMKEKLTKQKTEPAKEKAEEAEEASWEIVGE